MEPFIIGCFIFAVLVLVVAVGYRFSTLLKECGDRSKPQGVLPMVGPGLAGKGAQNPIYNPAYNQRALASPGADPARSMVLLSDAQRLTPKGRPPMLSPDELAVAHFNLMTGEAPLDLSDGQWVQAYMTAREMAEENEFKITGIRPSMYEPKLPKVVQKKKPKNAKKMSTGPKKILPPLEELTEERFYQIPTKMIPMDQNRDEHLDLNRYRNILPYNDSWVQLTETIGVTRAREQANQQYVNANYIPDFSGKNPKMYIACQGPKDNGLPQFWRMVWQEKIRSIAMLTGLVEKNRVKCAQYWPGQPGQEIAVSGMAIKCLSAARVGKNKYITTELEITGGGEKRRVTHFWFDCWPDLGVPSFKDGLHLQTLLDDANALNNADAKKRGSKAPVVVHCSAGIGRTGVLIALDHAMDSLDRQNNTTFNLIQTVDTLRDHRGGMLQTWEQSTFLLKLLHRAFAERAKAAADAAKTEALAALSSKPAAAAAPPVKWHRDRSGVEITEEFI